MRDNIHRFTIFLAQRIVKWSIDTTSIGSWLKYKCVSMRHFKNTPTSAKPLLCGKQEEWKKDRISVHWCYALKPWCRWSNESNVLFFILLFLSFPFLFFFFFVFWRHVSGCHLATLSTRWTGDARMLRAVCMVSLWEVWRIGRSSASFDRVPSIFEYSR